MSLYGQENALRQLQQLLTNGIPGVNRPTDAAESAETAGADPVTGTGRALDDQVVVTVADGQVEQVELGPRAKRAADDDLAAAIKDATNAALADYLSRRTAGVGAPDFDRLLTQLQHVSADGAASMQATTERLDAALRAVQQQATRPR